VQQLTEEIERNTVTCHPSPPTPNTLTLKKKPTLTLTTDPDPKPDSYRKPSPGHVPPLMGRVRHSRRFGRLRLLVV
jgi:hypothetical protein